MIDHAHKVRDKFINKQRDDCRRIAFHWALFVVFLIVLSIFPSAFL